ncbi:MAG: histidine kinase [Pseudonocardia sp.]|nr:histidine kinase [Pseudonocardia sp.]
MTVAGPVRALPGSDSTWVVRRFVARERQRAFWVVAWFALAGAVLGVLVPLLAHGPAVTFQAVTVVFRVVGGSFAACGLVAWRRRPDNHSGRLMTATGFAFLASPLLAQLDAPLARTAGLLLRNVWLLFLVAILLTFLSGGRLRTRTDRVVVGAVAMSLLVISPLWLLFQNVPGNLLFLWPDAGIAGAVDAVQQWLYLPIAVTVSAVVGARWWAASRPGRRALLPSVAGSTYLLFFTVVLTAGLVGLPVPYTVFWVLAFSVAMVPVAFLTGLLRSRLARGGLVELFRGMKAMHPADLRAALARALGDPDLVIAYPTGSTTFVDDADRPVALPAADGDRSAAMVERDGQVIAALIYDRSLDDDPELVEAVGGAAAIALENQQLHVEAQDRLAEVRASRERIIAAGDAERRRIERNLHDGAQQRLATLALQLSLIGRQIRGDPAAEQLVTSASDELAQSLEELRELARGIHPAALDQGLDIALDALALRSAVPTTVCCERGPRLPEPVEFAAYFVASEALANVTKYARATAAAVHLVRTGSGAVIEISDDGVGGADPARGSGLRGLADRVEALDGTLLVASPPGGGTVITAELPCR